MDILKTIGRRKTAVARVTLQEGDGNIKINGRKFSEYFVTPVLQMILKQPLKLCEAENKFDVIVNVDGGGTLGQAEACRLGISRALVQANSENRPALKKAGLLTRDPRMVERKKFGRKKARRSFQFVKR